MRKWTNKVFRATEGRPGTPGGAQNRSAGSGVVVAHHPRRAVVIRTAQATCCRWMHRRATRRPRSRAVETGAKRSRVECGGGRRKHYPSDTGERVMNLTASILVALECALCRLRGNRETRSVAVCIGEFAAKSAILALPVARVREGMARGGDTRFAERARLPQWSL